MISMQRDQVMLLSRENSGILMQRGRVMFLSGVNYGI